ncbi:MAG TPA: PQQ-binding-like beta-propeller repeat protein, partial [Candidatus Xenobia bacterium]
WTWNSGDDDAALLSRPPGGPCLAASGDAYGVNRLTALDPDTGAVLWTRPRAYLSNLPPTLGPDGRLYGDAFDCNAINVWNPSTGAVQQHLDLPFAPTTRPTADAQGTLFVGGSRTPLDAQSEALHAIDSRTGQEKWSVPLRGGLIAEAPVVAHHEVLCTGRDGKVYALDEETGTPRWVFAPQTPITHSVAVSPAGTVFAVDEHDTVYALHEGQPTWTAPLQSPPPNPYGLPDLDVSQPLLAAPDGHVYASTSGHSVRALDGQTGTQLWEHPADTFQPPTLDAQGDVLVTNSDGSVLALSPSQGDTTAPGAAVLSTLAGTLAGY